MVQAKDFVAIPAFIIALAVWFAGGIPEETDLKMPEQSRAFHLSNIACAFSGTMFVIFTTLNYSRAWIIMCVVSTCVSALISSGFAVDKGKHEHPLLWDSMAALCPLQGPLGLARI